MKKIINYSGIPVLVLIATLAFMPFSCSKEAVKENPLTDNSSQLIKVSGEDANAATKTTLEGLVTWWIQTSDKVGIYSPQARTETGGNGSEIVNAEFTAASTGTTSNFTGTMFWGVASTSHTFYAYYPYAEGSAASTVVPVSLATAQTQLEANNSSHIGALDFMVATPATVISPANTDAVGSEVHLNYNHLFTILEFQIKGSGSLNAVKLVGTSNPVAFSGGTVDITQSPVTGVAYTFASQTGTTTQAVVTLTAPAELSTITATKVYMVINPGTQTDTCLIGLSSDGTTWTYISKAAPGGGFLRGMKYGVPIDKADAGAAPAIDQDGNTFGIITIGTQVWMAENLKTTKYNDGTAIPNIKGKTVWDTLSTGAYCWYGNDATTNKATYGALYNWYAVDPISNGGKNICPVGWHVPTDAEWATLTTYLTNNGFGYEGNGSDIAKSMAGTSGWTADDVTAGTVGNDQASSNNTSGFTALPGGYRNGSNGTFYLIGSSGYWWSSTESGTSGAWTRRMSYDHSDVYRSSYIKTYGYSVRCLRDI